jgi:hypothetical protein
LISFGGGVACQDNMTKYSKSIVDVDEEVSRDVGEVQDVAEGEELLSDLDAPEVPDLEVCVQVAPGVLRFAPTEVLGESVEMVTVTNCGPVDARVVATLEGPFSLAADPGLVRAGESVTVAVSFLPVSGGEAIGALRFAAEQATAEVQLSGVGFEVGPGHCPEALMDARVVFGGPVVEAPLTLQVLETAIFDGDRSRAFDGARIEALTWQVSPRHGTSAIFSDGNQFVSFFNPGAYSVELSVIDSYGRSSCRPDRVDVLVEDNGGPELVVALSYEAIGAEPPRTGADVDLHLRHPEGWWNDPRWDCSATSSRNPRWSVETPAHNPIFSGDARHSSGGESIHISVAEPLVYTVGILAIGLPGEVEAVIATLTVYFRGRVAWSGSKRLRQYEFWTVGGFNAAVGELDVVDEVTQGFP